MTVKQPKRRSARKSPTKAAKTKRAPAAGTCKLDRMIHALRQPKGASISDLMALTGWQIHSVRGAIAGALKKKRGLNVISEKVHEERIYRIGGRP